MFFFSFVTFKEIVNKFYLHFKTISIFQNLTLFPNLSLFFLHAKSSYTMYIYFCWIKFFQNLWISHNIIGQISLQNFWMKRPYGGLFVGSISAKMIFWWGLFTGGAYSQVGLIHRWGVFTGGALFEDLWYVFSKVIAQFGQAYCNN